MDMKDFINKKYNFTYKDTDSVKLAEDKEEWILVKGYKGTDENMKCRDYQFEMDKTFYMPEELEIKTCESGFHFCTKLHHVYNYYHIGDGNRFFEVEAMVRKSDYDSLNVTYNDSGLWPLSISLSDTKLTSKSIRFIRELGRDEILTAGGHNVSEWTEDQKDRAITEGYANIYNEVAKIRKEKERAEQTEKLLSCGYNEWLAKYIASHDMFEKAYAVGCQENLSMDMKVFAIFNNDRDDD